MNESDLQAILQGIYVVCNRIEITLPDLHEFVGETDDFEYWIDLYDQLYYLTTEIEERYGLI